MYNENRRNDLDIQADILRVATSRGGALKTQIVYEANLNFRYFPTEKARIYIDTIEALYAL